MLKTLSIPLLDVFILPSISFIILFCHLIVSIESIIRKTVFIFLSLFFSPYLVTKYSPPPPPSVQYFSSLPLQSVLIYCLGHISFEPPCTRKPKLQHALFPCENNLLGLVEPIPWSCRGEKFLPQISSPEK